MNYSKKMIKLMIKLQRSEITDSIVYERVAQHEKNPENKKVLLEIANEEKSHADIWKKYTQKEIKTHPLVIIWYTLLSYITGYTFMIRFLEKREFEGAKTFEALAKDIPEVETMIEQDKAHEDALINMLKEERLDYVGDIVLGLNDALIELTGAIAGVTFALANTRAIALVGIITGVAATLSMSTSNYLAQSTTGKSDAFKASVYTGIAYLITVTSLILPYLLFPSHMYIPALITMLAIVICIILLFNYYVSVTKAEPFFPRFCKMAIISLGVSFVAFTIGILAKKLLGVEV